MNFGKKKSWKFKKYTKTLNLYIIKNHKLLFNKFTTNS